MSIKTISHYLKNFFLKTSLSQSMKEIFKTLAAEMHKIIIVYLQKSWKTFLKLKLTTIILSITSYFTKEMLKQIWLQTMSYMGPKIWDLVPKEVKQVTTLNKFKVKIKIWKLENCPYRFSRSYLPQIGFIT